MYPYRRIAIRYAWVFAHALSWGMFHATVTGRKPRAFLARTVRRAKRGRPALGSAPASVESVRLDPELRDQTRAEGTTTSEVIREALRRFLKAA